MRHLFQAIKCKYLGPTNTKGSRIRVTCAAKTKLVEWKSELNTDENYYQAAFQVATELNWLAKCDLVGGVTKSGVYVFVLTPKEGA